MWSLDNQTPFAAERTWVRDKNGAEIWVLAIKASFDVTANGQVSLAPEYTDDSKTELRYDTDLPECKQATDVLVNGTAYASKGYPAKEWSVNLRVGPIDKTLFIRGDRLWQKGLVNPLLTEAEPIASLPLSYRYAYGASFYETDPIGRGYTQENNALVEQYAPNIEHPDSQVQRLTDQSIPAGFTAIPGHWQTRKSWAGTYD